MSVSTFPRVSVVSSWSVVVRSATAPTVSVGIGCDIFSVGFPHDGNFTAYVLTDFPQLDLQVTHFIDLSDPRIVADNNYATEEVLPKDGSKVLREGSLDSGVYKQFSNLNVLTRFNQHAIISLRH